MLVNMKFSTGKDVLLAKDLLGKAATSQRFEYSQFGSELKKQTDTAKKQYQGLDEVFELNKKEEIIIKKEKPITKTKLWLKRKLRNIINQIYTTTVNTILLSLLIKFMNTMIHLLKQNTIVWSGFIMYYLTLKM